MLLDSASISGGVPKAREYLSINHPFMFYYLLKRIINSILILLGVSWLVYLLIYLAPADPAQVIAGQRFGKPPKPEVIAWIRTEHGLDQPILWQYLRWLGQTLQGDLGRSIRTNELVLVEIKQRWGFSLILGTATMGFVLLLGLPAGVLAALRPHSGWDQLTRLLALTGVSIPEFWLAFLLILIFAVHLGWLPSFGAKGGLHLILPLLTLGLAHLARLSRLTRSILLEELHQDYMRTAQAKGLARVAAISRHALPNIAVPFITLVAYQFSALISGTIIVETVFSWPGLGSYYIIAVDYRDIPVIQAMVLLYALIIIFSNLLADLSYGLFDPRIRLG